MLGQPGIPVRRTNTILYCQAWKETVHFYREQLELAVALEKDWLVEFHLFDSVFVSIADAHRATLPAGRGHGITLSWQVERLWELRKVLGDRGVEVSEITKRWGADCLFFRDPAGHRIELWQPGN